MAFMCSILPFRRYGRRPVCTACGVLAAVWLLYAAALHDVRAQRTAMRLQPLSPVAQARSGVYLLQQGQTTEALPLLKAAFRSRPSLRLRTHGSVAYWLGEAYSRAGDTVRAHDLWYRGYHQLDEAGVFDVRLADAYLRTLTRNVLLEERLDAVDAYATLLGTITADADPSTRRLYQRRLAQIAPLLPQGVFDDVVAGKRTEDPKTWTFRPHGGDSLRAWWEGMDPFPATAENERLEEHVTRLVHAQQTFSCREKTSALDARGTVYLRFGAPYKRRDLSYKDAEFFREVFRFGVHVSESAFPDSELWTYPQIDDSGFYLFAEAKGSDCYRLATTNDLLPNQFTVHRSDSDRSLNIAYSALIAMRSIYRELALYHGAFGSRYSDIANYAGRQEMNAALARASQSASGEYTPRSGGQRVAQVGKGIGQTRLVFSNPTTGLVFPSTFVSRMVTRAAQEDAAAEHRREENMPRQHTALHDDTPRLPVSVRTARFLTENGSTRTEIYWGVWADQARLKPDEDDEAPAPSMIRFSVVQHNGDRSQSTRRHRRHQLPSNPRALGPSFVAPPIAFQSSSVHHLTMQWTQHRLWQQADGSVAGGLGPKQRFALAKADSLRPLRAEGTQLEMSDLKALVLPDSALTPVSDPLDSAHPYPFDRITAAQPLVLSFEVYHLTFGPDDRTRYTVNYQVKGATRRGWTQLFRGQDTQQTGTTITRSGTSRRSDEVIVLDLSQIEADESQDLRVTVTITDDHTGASVTRSLDFVLAAEGNSGE